MDKNILTFGSVSREKELVTQVYDFTYSQRSCETIERILSDLNDPFDVFSDTYSSPDPNESYSGIRLRVLTRLLLSLANADIGESVSCLSDGYPDHDSARSLVSHVTEAFELRGGEKLVAIFYSDTAKIKAVYESQAWESFGCDADNERLKTYVSVNAPCKMIMIHSHPGCVHSVSSDDIRFTRDIAAYAESLGSELIEHFVLSCMENADDYVGIIRG